MPSAGSSPRGRSGALIHLAAAVAAAALLLTACGQVVDDQKLEDQITANLEHRTGVRIVSAVCPTGVDPEPGRRFDCVVTARDGRRAAVTVRIRNKDADVTIVAVSAKR